MGYFAFQQADRERALLMDHLGACERIVQTPMPLVYSLKIRQFITLFLLSLSFALLGTFDSALLVPPITMLIAYPILSLDQTGIELESPFSTRNLSHLPLERITATIERNLEGLLEAERALGRRRSCDRLNDRRPPGAASRRAAMEPLVMRNPEPGKIAFVGDYLPRKCGIATFTHDMYASVAGRFPEAECTVVPVNDRPEGYDYAPEVRFEVAEPDLDSYLRAADFLNFANTDVVSLQHEYGIYGGPAGGHVLGLVRDLRMPVVTTFHTILREPDPDQRRVLVQLAELSARVVVMTDRARMFLREIYGVPEAKIDLIAHGIPDTPFVAPGPYKEQFGVEGRPVALTFGLLSPNKGIEHMLRAIPEILSEVPDFVYIVLGATHPELVRQQGERYRLGLERLARELGIERHVIFYNRFVELDELTEFIRAADVYVTPYLNPAQITSGTLAYSFGCGKAIVSTPYWHAEELLADGRGVLVPFADPRALAKEIRGLLGDEPRRMAMGRHAYELGREMVWARSAQHYMDSFRRARHGRQDRPSRPLAVRTLAEQQGRAARLAVRPPPRDDRRDRHAPACHLRDPEFRGWLLHRRQCQGPAVDGAARRAGPGRAADPPPRDRRRGLPPGGLQPRSGTVPQLHGLRPSMAGGSRVRGLPGAGRLGPGHLRRPVAPAGPPALGRRPVRAGPARRPGDDLAAGVGLQPAGDSRVPPAIRR